MAERCAPEFALTETDTVALPLPEVGFTVIQFGRLVMLQEHPAEVVIETLDEAPAAPIVIVVGLTA